MADIAYWNASNPAVTPDGRLSPAFSRFLNEITRQFSPELDTGIETRLTNVEAVNATQDGLITANTAAIVVNTNNIAAAQTDIADLQARMTAQENILPPVAVVTEPQDALAPVSPPAFAAETLEPV